MDNRELRTTSESGSQGESTETLITGDGTTVAPAIVGREWAMRGGESV